MDRFMLLAEASAAFACQEVVVHCSKRTVPACLFLWRFGASKKRFFLALARAIGTTQLYGEYICITGFLEC